MTFDPVVILLVYLAIGATIWALVLHPVERARLESLSVCAPLAAFADIIEAIVTWPIAPWTKGARR